MFSLISFSMTGGKHGLKADDKEFGCVSPSGRAFVAENTNWGVW